MSENAEQDLGIVTPAKNRDKPSPLLEHENPTTHQMRIIGQRRSEAEAKLEEQLRGSRQKSSEL
ncbi:hypothetical protein AB6813_08320 [bacterium RCC_150]